MWSYYPAWTFNIGLILIFVSCSCENVTIDDQSEPVLYYYGIEESERSLPLCGARQACAALVRRYWRAPALVRLCRCVRRRHCDSRAAHDSRLDLNNHAHLQFCHPVTSWPLCTAEDTPLTVESAYDHMNPDELEQLHHQNIQLRPPKFVFNCRCREPNYWKYSTTQNGLQVYQCSSLLLCKTGDYCGNVSNDLNALYQSCLCPKRHICVHNGGVANYDISELMYRGKGWKAYCQRFDNDTYEDYDY